MIDWGHVVSWSQGVRSSGGKRGMVLSKLRLGSLNI